MSSHKELLAQKEELAKRIEEARRIEGEEALVTIKQLIATFGFTVQQVFPWQQAAKKKVQDKYYDSETGKSWTGRGKRPKWLEGKDLSQYEIVATSTLDWTAPRDENNPFPIQ